MAGTVHHQPQRVHADAAVAIRHDGNRSDACDANSVRRSVHVTNHRASEFAETQARSDRTEAWSDQREWKDHWNKMRSAADRREAEVIVTRSNKIANDADPSCTEEEMNCMKEWMNE